MSSGPLINRFARKDWKEKSHFHPHPEREVLSLISQTLIKHQGPKKPLILLDLDSTLYEVGPRTVAIVQEWLRTSPSVPQDLHQALLQLRSSQLGYSVKDTLTNLGFAPVSRELEKIAFDLKAYWWDRFFSSDYMFHDRPYPGTVEYVNHLLSLGAQLCYLTGRDETRMREGTEANLIRDGFPYHPSSCSLVMRKEAKASDAEHKAQAASLLGSSHQVIASFENEPFNLVTLSNLLPETMHIYVDTVCSDSLSEPGKNLYYVRGFSSFLEKH